MLGHASSSQTDHYNVQQPHAIGAEWAPGWYICLNSAHPATWCGVGALLESGCGLGLETPGFFLDHIAKAKELLYGFLLLFLTLHSFVPCLSCNSINELANLPIFEDKPGNISYFLWLEQNGSHLPLPCTLSSKWLIKKEKRKIPEVFSQILQACPESCGVWAFRRGFLLIVTHQFLALVGSTPKPMSRMGAYLLATWPCHLTEAFLWVWYRRRHKVPRKKQELPVSYIVFPDVEGGGRGCTPAQKYVNRYLKCNRLDSRHYWPDHFIY